MFSSSKKRIKTVQYNLFVSHCLFEVLLKPCCLEQRYLSSKVEKTHTLSVFHYLIENSLKSCETYPNVIKHFIAARQYGFVYYITFTQRKFTARLKSYLCHYVKSVRIWSFSGPNAEN